MLELTEAKQVELKALCERFNVNRLYLFGSAVTGTFDPDTSDLDILVDFRHSKDMNMADQYFGLLEGLETIFKRSVDLVTERSIRNPYFKKTVNQTRTSLYAS